MDIRRFAVFSSSAAALREGREAAQSKEAACVAVCFADLGLPWPRPRAHRKVGRPALRTLYLEIVYKHILSVGDAKGVAAELPRWWQEGMPVIRTEEAFAAGLSELQPSSADAPTAVKQEPRDDGERGDAIVSVDAETADEENGPSPKRPKVHVAQEMEEWFVAWAGMNLRARGMNMIDSLRRAQFL